MSSLTDPEQQRSEQLERWEFAAPGWGRRAREVREMGMPVSVWMIDRLGLSPGERLLELAAGPGDTGFMAAELIAPGGTLITSDASEKMLEIAKARAQQQGVAHVEFKQLQLEWIDLETATVDAALCRWGVMLSVDPGAALQECRRVLKPGGRLALAVWDAAELNPWATVPAEVLLQLGHTDPPPPGAPGPFALSDRDRLTDLLQQAGFVESVIESVTVERRYDDFEEFLDETLDLSFQLGSTWARLSDSEQSELMALLAQRAEPFTAADGSLLVPGRSLVVLASA